MNTARSKLSDDPISYDAAAVLATGGIKQTDLDNLVTSLSTAREESLNDLDRWRANDAGKESLDPAFIDLPERLLADYGTRRQRVNCFPILQTSRRLREAVDRVVVLGIGGSYMGTRALFGHAVTLFTMSSLEENEVDGLGCLSEGFNIDNDSAQGLLDVLRLHPSGGDGDDLLAQWAMLVVSKSGGTLETAAATRLFLSELSKAVGGDAKQIAERVVPITGASGKLASLAKTLGCPDVFGIPDGVGGRFSVFTAVGLLPASLVGIDVVRLLEGCSDDTTLS